MGRGWARSLPGADLIWLVTRGGVGGEGPGAGKEGGGGARGNGEGAKGTCWAPAPGVGGYWGYIRVILGFRGRLLFCCP